MQNCWSSRVLLLGLGTQKSGTSWFGNYLQSHPQVFMSPIKEMHFFKYSHLGGNWPNSYFEKRLIVQTQRQKNQDRINDLQERLAMGSSIEKYKDFFSRRMGKLQYCCEITPAYSKLSRAELQRIRDSFENVKPFLFLRNPTERLWSQHKFSNNNLSRNELLASLNDALNKESYLSRSNYKSCLQNIDHAFGPSSYHCEFFENLFTAEAIQNFCNFAGISFHPGNFKNKRNESRNFTLPESERRLVVKRLEEQYRFCADYFEKSLPESWKIDIAKFL